MTVNTHKTIENRYEVLKNTDIAAALTGTEQRILAELSEKVHEHRMKQGKGPLQGVFVEKDWPEYVDTVLSIEQRINTKPETG